MLSAKFTTNHDELWNIAKEDFENSDDKSLIRRSPIFDKMKDDTTMVRGSNQAIMSLIGRATACDENGLLRVW